MVTTLLMVGVGLFLTSTTSNFVHALHRRGIDFAFFVWLLVALGILWFILASRIFVGEHRKAVRKSRSEWAEQSTGNAPLLRPAEAEGNSLVRPAEAASGDSAAQLLRADAMPEQQTLSTTLPDTARGRAS